MADSTEGRETACSTLVGVWDLLAAALSYLVSGSGEHPIPDGLMTQHFPHHFISLMAEGQTCTYDYPLINYKAANV